MVAADIKLTAEGEGFLKESNPKTVVFTKCDVTKRADLENLVKVSKDAFGDVADIWVAGAGVFEPVRILTLLKTPIADISPVLE